MQSLERSYLFIVRDWGREILVEPEERSLPSLTGLPNACSVRDVADYSYLKYGVDICVLFKFDSPAIAISSDPDDLTFVPINCAETRVVVAQPWSHDLPPGCRLIWVPVGLAGGEGRSTQLLVCALQLLWDRAIGRVREPLGRPEWFRDLIAFASSSSETSDPQRLTHWSGSETAAVIRMETGEHSVWIKVAAHDKCETPMKVVSSLSYLSLPYVPATLGYFRSRCARWAGLAQEHMEGITLRKSGKLGDWCETARRVAELQIATIDKTDALLASGCEDGKLVRIRRGSSQLFRWISSEILSRDDLLGIGAYRNILPALCERVQAVLGELAECDIPPALVRCRFSADDVVVHPSQGPYFVTWIACAVSVPFVWGNCLLEAVKQDSDDDCRAVREAYLRPWCKALGEKIVARMTEHAPLLAALLDAVRVADMEEMTSLDDDYLPTERREWAWELSQNPSRLGALRDSLTVVVHHVKDSVAAT